MVVLCAMATLGGTFELIFIFQLKIIQWYQTLVPMVPLFQIFESKKVQWYQKYFNVKIFVLCF